MPTLAGWQVLAVAYQALRRAGVPSGEVAGTRAETATAIAYGESGLRTDAHNASGEDSRGLWQINGDAHPQYDNDSMFDPRRNADAMAQISRAGTDWTPWTVYTSGRYRQFVDRVAEDRAVLFGRIGADGWDDLDDSYGLLPDLALGVDENVVQPVAGAIDAAGSFVAWVTQPNLWLRVGLAIVAVVAVILGIIWLSRDTLGDAAAAVAAARTGG